MKKLAILLLLIPVFMMAEVVFSEDFEAMTVDNFGDWQAVSVTGDQVWKLDETHGFNSSKCLKMSGYVHSETTTYVNEDWLISPVVNLAGQSEAYLKFKTAQSFNGNDLEVYVTDNYSGDVATTTWVALSPELSGGSWSWTDSGMLDIAAQASANTRFAFKFTCDDNASRTWEVDEVEVSTDGGVTPPPVEAIWSEDFEAMTVDNFGNWEAVSVTGDQVWKLDETHGYNNSKCLKMSGYVHSETTTYINEDWLISPAVDLTNNDEVFLSFMTAQSFNGNDLEVYVTDNYTGDVTTTTWVALSPALSGGGWSWVESGNINVSAQASATTRVAFKFTCDDTSSRTWEVDEVKFVAEGGVTPPPTNEVIYENFDSMTADNFGEWRTISVTGDQVWKLDTSHGYNGTQCLKMSGYVHSETTTYVNEDWLVSPVIDLSSATNPVLTFKTAQSFNGNDLEVYATSNFTGDVTTTTWVALNPALSSGSWSWTDSGELDITAQASANTRIAFKFTCDDTASRTWEVDEFKVTAEQTTGANDVVNSFNPALTNYPNPFNPSTAIRFTTKVAGNVSVDIYNLKGQKINTLFNGVKNAGTHTLKWNGVTSNGNTASSGIYFVRLKACQGTSTKKMLMLK